MTCEDKWTQLWRWANGEHSVPYRDPDETAVIVTHDTSDYATLIWEDDTPKQPSRTVLHWSDLTNSWQTVD